MGTLAAAPIDSDGKQDVYYHCPGKHRCILSDLIFDYVTQSSGVEQITILSSGWGAKWIDADNDGQRFVRRAKYVFSTRLKKTVRFIKYKQSLLMREYGKRGFPTSRLW